MIPKKKKKMVRKPRGKEPRKTISGQTKEERLGLFH